MFQHLHTKLLSMLQDATPTENCFAAPLHISVSKKFQRVTAAVRNTFTFD